jgi:hypothetical protein
MKNDITTPFSIAFSGGAPSSFADLGLAEPKIKLASQKECVLSFKAPGIAMDANALAVEGSHVVVYNDAAPFFAGRLFRIARSGDGRAEEIGYEVRDAWWDLARIVYQQQWTTMASRDTHGYPTTAAEYLGELILGMDAGGNQLSNGQVIADVVAYAASCGAYIQVGEIGVAAPIPFDQVTDLPCSEVIRRMLRWSPDAVVWINYTTTPPAFNVTPRAACAAYNLPFIGAPERQDITGLPDLIVSSVGINYLQTNTSSDGPSELQVTPDVWPPSSNPRAIGGLPMTVRLAGAVSTYQRQAVTTAPIPTDNSGSDGSDGSDDGGAGGGPASDPTIQWWQRKVPWLANLGTPGDYDAQDVGNQLVITNVYGVYQQGQGDDDGSGTVEVDLSSYPNELLVGTVSDWMNVQWAKTNWSALVKYSYPDSTDSYSNQDWQAVNVFGPDDGSGSSAPCLVTAVATATNAATQTYTQLTAYTAPEPVPDGLAEYLYNCLCNLQYEGSYTAIADEISPARLGTVLNLIGGREEWAVMNALVQQIDQDFESGTTVFRFGTFQHLRLADLMELLKSTRTRGVASHYSERKTGQSTQGGTPIDGAAQGASDGGGTQPSAANVLSAPFLVTSSNGGDGGDSSLSVMVNQYSYLFNSPSITDKASIDNLGSSIEVNAGDYIWLEVDYNSDLTLNGDPQIGSGSSWPSDDAEIQYNVNSDGDQPYIDTWWVPIAKIVSRSDASPGTSFTSPDGTVNAKIVQLLNTHLILTCWAVNGMPVNVPTAWTGAAY